MEMKAGLAFARIDLKRLAWILARKRRGGLPSKGCPRILKKIYLTIKREVFESGLDFSLCLQSETHYRGRFRGVESCFSKTPFS